MATVVYDTCKSLLLVPKHTRWQAPLLISVEAILCSLIILNVPYTEIDWETYMIQVSKVLPPNYETDYTKIDGPSGPLVYPAIHVWIHSLLYYLTDQGRDIQLAQCIYAALYLTTLAFVFASYRRVNAPPWLLVPLVLSKRLHSIFLLRMFNDCWATFFFWVAVYAATRKQWFLTAMAWTLGLGTKMTMLLPLPAVALLLIQGAGLDHAAVYGALAWVIQFGTAAPFLGYEHLPKYMGRAFELSRVFLYKWTVNWRFVSEDVFLSKPFAYGLLALHVSFLVAYIHTTLVRPSSTGLPHFLKRVWTLQNLTHAELSVISQKVTPRFVMDAMLGCMVIGLLFARSMHYQFYAYLGWATPYLLWRANGNSPVVLILCGLQEAVWLVYPATANSSRLVVAGLALQVMSLFNAQTITVTAVDESNPAAKKPR
ncbi:hypothetical protein BT93_L5705 [Corymbia citriodora subsp. variegata]|uniref:dolichyl-P-Man:Man5GlcNAc2-PP-dolichol alpha-1,3-mannosyltransferase n=1 Tax=Corymbia citriodora subsp. variegata TaxID=360336 RepID=A0A8T0CJK9_CORYI|nr:hypothetical protein BT93_L5705 [Corymbia citriodora subsp. variegata]